MGAQPAPEQLFTETFIADGYELAFHALGMGAATISRALGKANVDQSHWAIDETQSRDLAKKTRAWLATIDKKKLEQLEKKYGKHVPAFTLGGALALLVIGKASKSIDNHKSLTRPPRGPVRAETPEPAPVSGGPLNGAAPHAAPAPAPGESSSPSDALRAVAGRFDPADDERTETGDAQGLRPIRAGDGGEFGFDAND